MKQRLIQLVGSLKPGQRIDIAWSNLREITPYEHKGCVFGPVDQIFGNIIGAAYEIRFWENQEKRLTTFERLPIPNQTAAGQSLSVVSYSSFVWSPIEGYEPMENCHTTGGEEVGWIRPASIGKTRQQPWGTAAEWPGQWQAIPHRYDDEGQPLDWSLATYQPSYAAAKEWIERGRTNTQGEA